MSRAGTKSICMENEGKLGAVAGLTRLYCDASFFIALFSKSDQMHVRARSLFKEIARERVTLITAWPVVGETMTILRYHDGYRSALAFNNSLDLYKIIAPTENHYHQAVAIFHLKSKARKISFVDALSYLLITAELDEIPALSFDSDFKAMGLTVVR